VASCVYIVSRNHAHEDDCDSSGVADEGLLSIFGKGRPSHPTFAPVSPPITHSELCFALNSPICSLQLTSPTLTKHPPTTHSMADASDDEWEYEYSATETEDFYIPIDLSNVPSSQVPMNIGRRVGHPTMLKSRLRALDITRDQLPEPTVEDLNAQETAKMGEVQISGLHTANPLIMYNDQLLSCQWTSTIGTDMFFTTPGTNSGDVLRSLPSVDLMSLGTAKLVARVGRLRPRDDVVEGKNDAPPATDAVGEAGDDQGESDVRSESVALATAATSASRASISTKTSSANFLARLNEAKARRGETSRLVVSRESGRPLLVSDVDLPVRPANSGEPRANGDVSMGGT
jgi:hypothetical protein